MIRLLVTNESLGDLNREILPKPKNHYQPFCCLCMTHFLSGDCFIPTDYRDNKLDTLLGRLRTDPGGVTPNTYTVYIERKQRLLIKCDMYRQEKCM